MNPFTDIVFIFVFVFVILHYGLICIEGTNIVLQKLYIFLAVTMFSWLLYSLKSIRRQQPIKIWDVVSSGLIIGMLAFIGHTVFFDLLYMKGANVEASVWLKGMMDKTYFTHNIMLCIFISTFIFIGKSVGYVFRTELCN